MKWFPVQLVRVFVCPIVEIMFDIGFEMIKMSSVSRKQIVQVILFHTNQELTNDLTLSDCLNRSPATPVLSGLDLLEGVETHSRGNKKTPV